MQRDGNRITVSGRLTLDTASKAANALFDGGALAGDDLLVVDLSKVEAVDSSAVSVLLQWSRQALEKGVQLSFVNLPPNLCSLAKLYDVAAVLPISS
ncbi:MAG: STAS domain-containing protein [Sideroxydans sp.]|nr:STAS domain-containing protein [Sideroxydans sp.]